MAVRFRHLRVASVAPAVLRRRVLVALVVRVAHVPLVGLARAWVVCPPTQSDAVQWELVAPVVRAVRARVVLAVPVVPVLPVAVSVVLVAVPGAALVAVQAQVLVVPVAQVAVVVPVVSAEARRRSRVHGGVKSSTSFNHSRPRRTRRARRQYLRASSSSNVVARHRSSHRS